MSESEEDEAGERRRELESGGGVNGEIAPTHKMTTKLTHLYISLSIHMIQGGMLTVTDFVECVYTLSILMRIDNAQRYQRKYANEMA